MGVNCSCFACQHPTPENAGIVTLHRLRHIEFAERMDDVDLGRRIAARKLEPFGDMAPFVVRKVAH